MTEVYHILLPVAIVAWNVGVVYLAVRWSRTPLRRIPNLLKRPRRGRSRSSDEPVKVFRDGGLW